MNQIYLFEQSEKLVAVNEVTRSEGFTYDFPSWLINNWHIYKAFETRTFRLIKSNCKHAGAKMIIENIRWQSALAERESQYKINNNRAPDLSRLFHLLHPKHDGFFRNRDRKVA